jgi:hypothetical protein
MGYSGPLSKLTTRWKTHGGGGEEGSTPESFLSLIMGEDATFPGDVSNASTKPVGEEITISASYEALGGGPLAPGSHVSFRHGGKFQCVACAKDVKKLFDGFCFPCLKTQAQADKCVMNPHLCHFANGTCRDPSWGVDFCYQPHFVYLSHTDKFKVGITRKGQVPTRWIDQGATAASLVARVNSRHQAGVLEKILAEVVSDRSHWSNMLKAGNTRPSADEVLARRSELLSFLSSHPAVAAGEHVVDKPLSAAAGSGSGPAIEFLPPRVVFIEYPLPDTTPAKIVSTSLDKSPTVEGELLGVKGQYLFLPGVVFNVRRHEGYVAEVGSH